MKKSGLENLTTASVLFLVAIFITNIEAQTPPASEDAAESLRPFVTSVRSINPTDEDFSDLMPLIEKIGNSRVVVLGEGTHSEGTTSRAKARLVRFLHQKMGFDVLAWESGLFQSHAMNAALRNGDVPLFEAKRYLMSGGWANEEAIDPVFQYARASWQTARPLEMTGFDGGKPRAASQFFREYFTYLAGQNPALKLTNEDWEKIGQLQKRGYGFMSGEIPLEADRVAERKVLEDLLLKMQTDHTELLKTFSQKELIFAMRFIYDSLISEELKQIQKTKGGLEWNIARDKFMADSFRWLMSNLYPDRKIIIWAATAHLIRNGDQIENLKNKDWYQTAHHMGHHLFPLLGDDLYTIAFTAYSGQIGDVFPEPDDSQTQIESLTPAPLNSFEETAHRLNQPYLFLDLRKLPQNHWLRGKFVSVALGRFENSADWSEVVDAFFFIDQAEPIKYLAKQN